MNVQVTNAKITCFMAIHEIFPCESVGVNSVITREIGNIFLGSIERGGYRSE